MDEQKALSTPVESGWKDRHWIVLGMVLVLLMRAWQLGHTEVAARDTLNFIRVAWQLEHGPLQPALKKASHHPGYPVTVLAVSWIVRPGLGDDPARAWQISAQVASGLASILLFLPTFYLGRHLFSARVSFWASLLLQFLPAGGRVMGDGLSEALFLLCVSTGLLLALRGVASGSVWQLTLAGLFSGLAYLTRPEGAVVALAAGMVLLGLQATAHWRKPWGQLLAGETGLTLAFLAVAVPFMVLIGKFSVKQATDDLVQIAPFEEMDMPTSSAAVGGPLLAVWQVDGKLSPTGKLAWGAQTLVEMLAKGFFYVLWLPALVGLWWYRERFRSVPGAWVLLVACLILGAALFRVAVYLGYLSERHTLVILMCGLYWAVAALEGMAQTLARSRPQLAWSWFLVLLLPVAGWGTVKSLQPLHPERVGFREAGYWMAGHTDPEELIYDPFGWTSYYAGRWFHEPFPGVPAPSQLPWRYVVLEETGNKHPHLLGYEIALRLIKEKQGQVLKSWPTARGRVVVYRLALDRESVRAYYLAPASRSRDRQSGEARSRHDIPMVRPDLWRVAALVPAVGLRLQLGQPADQHPARFHAAAACRGGAALALPAPSHAPSQSQ